MTFEAWMATLNPDFVKGLTPTAISVMKMAWEAALAGGVPNPVEPQCPWDAEVGSICPKHMRPLEFCLAPAAPTLGDAMRRSSVLLGLFNTARPNNAPLTR